MTVKISLCIPTHRRAQQLLALLKDLSVQELLPYEVVVVDNDADESARPVVERFRASGCPFPLVYAVQPERSIPLTRNLTVALASGEWLAFVDDDERAPPGWLRTIWACAQSHAADGVLAPVEPRVPDSAPDWIRKGDFYEWPRVATGTVVPRKLLRFGNLLLRGTAVRELPGPFDPAFALSAGEDVDMLVRMVNAGARLVWCNEAAVWEPVEEKRLSLRWLLMRGYSGGQAFGWIRTSGRLGRVNPGIRIGLLLQWFTQMLLAVFVAVLLLPLGRHRSVTWLIKGWANAGKLTSLFGRRYSAYA